MLQHMPETGGTLRIARLRPLADLTPAAPPILAVALLQGRQLAVVGPVSSPYGRVGGSQERPTVSKRGWGDGWVGES